MKLRCNSRVLVSSHRRVRWHHSIAWCWISVARVHLGGQAVASIGITVTLSRVHVSRRDHSLDGTSGSDDGGTVGSERKLSSCRCRAVVDPDGEVLLAALQQQVAQDVVETFGVADALAGTGNILKSFEYLS